MRISYSSLETFKTCPLKYKFQDIDKIRIPKSVELVFGSSVHATLKFMFERTPLYPTVDQIIDFFRETWNKAKVFINSEIIEEEKDIFLKEGISILEKFYKNNPPWNFNVVDSESRFEAELENTKTGEMHTLAGIIDRIDKNDDSYEIIDYKTSKRMMSQENLDNDFQMSIYCLGLMKRWPHLDSQKIKLSLYFLKHGEKISTSRTSEQVKEMKKNIINTINDIQDKIKNDNFYPTPSPLCDWCGYRQMCPMWKHLYSHQYSVISSQKDLELIVKEYFELKAQNEKNNEKLDELKTVIYGFMDEQKIDRVFGDEGYLTRKAQERISYDLEKVREILEPLGKWQEIQEANEKKLEKILSSLPDNVQEKIIQFRVKKQFTTLTASYKKITEKKK